MVREKRRDESHNEYLMNLIREDERENACYRVAVSLQGIADNDLIDRVCRAINRNVG